MSTMSATECNPGDKFTTRGKTWLHCGHYSAVRHVCAEADDGEQTIISAHEQVVRTHVGTPEEAQATLAIKKKSKPANV